MPRTEPQTMPPRDPQLSEAATRRIAAHDRAVATTRKVDREAETSTPPAP